MDANDILQDVNRMIRTQEDIIYRVEIMQERAKFEGVAIALPADYTEDDVDMAADELSYLIYGVES